MNNTELEITRAVIILREKGWRAPKRFSVTLHNQVNYPHLKSLLSTSLIRGFKTGKSKHTASHNISSLM